LRVNIVILGYAFLKNVEAWLEAGTMPRLLMEYAYNVMPSLFLVSKWEWEEFNLYKNGVGRRH
jgi:hypothetical protein